MCSSFFFNDTATTEIYTLSLHDALPISRVDGPRGLERGAAPDGVEPLDRLRGEDVDAQLVGREPLGPCLQPRGGVRDGELLVHRDRKSTRLNSSHANISYAVFCLKKKTT